MTEKEALERVDDLANQTANMIREQAEKYIRSGAVDLEHNSELPFWLPKLLTSAACLHAADQWSNAYDKEWMEARENLSHF